MNVGASANDVTGAVAFGAGLMLLGLAAWIPFRHRGQGAPTARGRWGVRALVVVGGFLGTFAVLGPVGLAIVDIHSLPRAVGSPPDASYRIVSFRTSDGLRLEGWFRPSDNGSTVIMLSGGGANRRSTLRHAELLVRHGYGVLLYDPRGSGRSEGMVNSYGWGWDKDATAAFDYLARRGDVDPRRIGALGLSTGADIAIDLASRRPALSAIVADGAAAVGYKDWHRVRGDELGMVPGWVMFKSLEVLTGRGQPRHVLADQLARARARSLFVSAKDEREWGELYDRAGGERSTLWYVPHASHTRALRQYPAEYERRVVGFLGRELRG
jgi:pimeloyl-ACP methyl ester carboxylesterase